MGLEGKLSSSLDEDETSALFCLRLDPCVRAQDASAVCGVMRAFSSSLYCKAEELLDDFSECIRFIENCWILQSAEASDADGLPLLREGRV